MGKKLEVLDFYGPPTETLDYNKIKDQVMKSSPFRPGHDEVSLSDIRHWCEVMQDDNPLYRDTEYARRSEYGGPIAPPAMVQTWSLEDKKIAIKHFVNGFLEFPDDPHVQLNGLLEEEGYSGVMATATEHTFHAPLKPGDSVYTSLTLAQVSDYDHFTRQGVGRYYTILYTFKNQNDEVICTETFRVLFYRPPFSTRKLYKG